MPETNGNVTQPQEKVNNYLVPAILSTFCCCMPFGIVSIVFASQVNTKLSVGDIVGAKDSAGKAKMWMLISVGLGLAFWVIYALVEIILIVPAAVAAATE